MNVFKYEIKQNKSFLIKWCISLAILTALFMQAAPLFVEDAGAMREIINNLGDVFTKSLNINPATFLSEVGFFSYIFNYISLIGAIQAMFLGINVISKEKRMKTADFLISKPKSRSKIFLEKLFAIFSCIIITEIVFTLTAIISLVFVSKGEVLYKPFILICLSLFFIQIIFMGLGLVISTIISKIKSPITITIGITFAFFLLGMIEGITGSETLRYLSPFRYVDNNYILMNQSYEVKYLILNLITTLTFILLSLSIYKKQDIESV